MTAVPGAREAFLYLTQSRPDLILLNVILSGSNGYDVCRKLKEQEELKNTPVIFLTSNSDEESIVRAFEAGATDFVTKPFAAAVLKARVHTHVRQKLMADELKVANQKLESAMQEIRLQVYKDPLTSLYNRRFFLENLEQWCQRCEPGQQVHMLLLDVDHFKSINDTFGHCTGDYMLFTVAELMQEQVGPNAVVGRWGGDEFLIMLTDVTDQEAHGLAEQIRDAVERHPFQFDGNSPHGSVTVGVARFHPELGIEQNIARVDKALYLGKREGRNCCVTLQEEFSEEGWNPPSR